MVTVGAPADRSTTDRRVALTPDSAAQFAKSKADVLIAAGLGEPLGHTDADYTAAGATVVADSDELWGQADIVVTVGPPVTAEGEPIPAVSSLRAGMVLVGLLAPHRNDALVQALVDGKITSLSMELVPRITRAQRMDALSSQASIAGYRAVIEAAYRLDKHFPLAMTAAGTLKPARIVVLGAGVAGLQVVATARRLGAVVEVSDIREAAKAEVESLGGKFIDPPDMEAGEGEGGYAREVGKDFLTLQREQLARHLAQADAVITTAAVPGRPAPRLVSQDMVEGMKPGSVIIDLAAASGGNCALTPNEGEIEHRGVTIVAAGNLAAAMPREASILYARNVLELAKLLMTDGELAVDTDDEVIAGTLLTHDGVITHAPTAERLGAPPPAPAEPAPTDEAPTDETSPEGSSAGEGPKGRG